MPEVPPVKETTPPKQAAKPKKESKSPPSEPEDKKDNINIIFIGHVGKNVSMNSTVCLPLHMQKWFNFMVSHILATRIYG